MATERKLTGQEPLPELGQAGARDTKGGLVGWRDGVGETGQILGHLPGLSSSASYHRDF